MALEYLSSGTVVTDQKLHFLEGKTIDGTGMFLSRIDGLAAHSVVGTSSGTFGVYMGTAQTGTRYNVLSAGIPSSTAEVLWDLQSGRVYRTATGTAYATYTKYADLMNEGRVYSIDIPRMLEGTADDVFVMKCPWRVEFGEYSVSVGGNRPSGTMDLGLHKGTGGALLGATLQLAGDAGSFHTDYQTMSGATYNTDQYIVVRSYAKTGTGTVSSSGFSNLRIDLREKLE